MSIYTEKKDPAAKGASAPQPKGTLIRDDQGRWVLQKEQKVEETNKDVEKVTNLDKRVIANTIAQSSIQLAQAGVKSARLDAELLLMYVLNQSKEQLVKNWTNKIKDEDMERYTACLERRMKREPVAYITGYKHFMGIKFVVDNRVLIPRPETEILVQRALQYIKKWPIAGEQLAIVDVGTGCGNIALSIAKEVNFVKIFAVDISSEALEVATINANILNLEQNVALLHGDLLLTLPQPVHLVIANLPYIRASQYDLLEPEIRSYEPRTALIAGEDGLDDYRRLLAQVPQYLLKGGKVMMEMDPEQIVPMRTLVLEHLPSAEIEVVQDMQGLDRVMVVHV